MRQTEYRRRNTALTEEIFEELQKASQDELNWLFRQIRYKVRRLDGQRMKVVTGSPRLQKSYVVSGNLWDFFVSRMRSSLMRVWMKGAIKLVALQRNHFASFKPVEFDPEEFAKFIEPELGERIVGVSKTIKRLVGAKVVGWYNSPGTSMQSLVDQLKPIFGEKRARLIAQTEVTRLNSEVKRLTAEQIGATEWWWSTRRDNLVCVKPMLGPDGKVYNGCRELHGKTFDIGLPMPPDGSHPGCRCDPVIVPPSTAARVRSTKPVIEGLMMQKFDPNQPRDEDGKWTDTGASSHEQGGKGVRKPKHGDNQPVRTKRILPGTKYSKLFKPEFLYHVSASSPEDIKEKGLLRSSKAAMFSGDYAVDWEVDHPVDGVFLANWEQVKSIKEQMDELGLESHIYEVWLPAGTVLYNDWMMPESSVQVEGDIEPERIDMLPDDFVPYEPGKSKRLISNLRWQEYSGDEPYNPDLEKWDEQKHPRRKDGEFAPKGMGEAGGASETSAERPHAEKPAPKSSVTPETGNEVEGRPQMGRNFDISAERETFENGNYTPEQRLRFKKRELTVKYAETAPFNDKLTEKDYIDKYIRRGWYPTDKDEPYRLVNPEGTRKRTVSRQGMRDYLDVVLNRGEYKANYDLPEGANVVPAVPERVKKPTTEPVPAPEPDEPAEFEGMDGAQVVEKLLKTLESQDYDKNDKQLLFLQARLEDEKKKLNQLVGDGEFDANNPEMNKLFEEVTYFARLVGSAINSLRESSANETVKAALKVKSGVKIKRHIAQGEGKFSKANEAVLNEGLDAFESIVSSDVDLQIQDVSFQYDRKKKRSSYNENGGYPYVTCGLAFKDSNVVHELGHHLERYGSGVREAAVAFFNKRTQGEKPVPMNNFGHGFRADEMCKPDKFVDPYVGKRYSDGATEVISVGLAYYYSNPAGFLRKDPEHFAFIYDVVHGKFSKKKGE